MSTPTETTVADVVAGRHDEGTVVTFTGIASCVAWRESKQGDTWATFKLLAAPTSVDALLFPAAYAEFGDGMGPTLADYRPQTVTVTGQVRAGFGYQPVVVVTDVRRHSEEPCESLESMRRQSERFNEMLRREKATA
jgi:hypothetical protein